MTITVAIAFTPAPSTDSPNLRARTSRGALHVFEGLIEVCFASIQRWNPDVRLCLVTTGDPGPEFGARLARLQASVLVTRFDHQPPPGFFPHFNASLFTLDAMSALSARADPDDRVVLIDPDVLCAGSLDALVKAIPPEGFLAYNVNDPPSMPVQGLSMHEAGRLHHVMDSRLTGTPIHFGGECYGFSQAAWQRIAPHVHAAWQFSLSRWRLGASRLVTEEHLLDFALRYADVEEANPYIRRIWTAPTYRNVSPSDLALSLWHLPSEKHRGLRRLSRLCRESGSWFWTASDANWRDRAAKSCGLTRRPLGRWLWDHGGLTARRVQAAVGRNC